MEYRPVALLVVAFLAVALAPMPYGFYTLLRLVVCGGAAFGAFRALEAESTTWALILGVTALLYNPFVRVPLEREVWEGVNVATAVLVALSAFRLRDRRGE